MGNRPPAAAGRGAATGEAATGAWRVGDELELEIGPAAHGGHCVARAAGEDGRSLVVFVRYALPGERAVVRLTEVSHGTFLRGDAVRILRAAPGRITPPCSHFGPGRCGGCDFQMAALPLQRELKAAVVREQLARLAGIDVPVVVRPLPADADTAEPAGAGVQPTPAGVEPAADVAGAGPGFGWRTRVRWAVDRDGAVGPRQLRRHAPVPIDGERPCLIAAPAISPVAPQRAGELLAAARAGHSDARGPGGSGGPDRGIGSGRRSARESRRRGRAAASRGRGGRRAELPELTLVARPDGAVLSASDPGDRELLVTESVAGREFRVAADGFWQVHPEAAATLTAAVSGAVTQVSALLTTGATAWDLYGGVGVFAPVLAAAVGPDGAVVSVEGDRAASALAAENLADLPQVRCETSSVEAFVRAYPSPPPTPGGAAGSTPGGAGAPAIVVLDPPRSGAGRQVCSTLAAVRPELIVYVACDPAALARDTKTLLDNGYRLTKLEAFDCFPQTHHVECVASYVPADR